MTVDSLVHLWSELTLLSLGIWLLIAVIVLYLARQPVQAAVRALVRLSCRQLRFVAARARHARRHLRHRARLSLLQLARENLERSMSHQLERLGITVRRDLASFPHLHREVHEQITRIDEDFRSTVETPARPPEWLNAVDTIARLPGREDPAVGRLLEDMHATLDRACQENVVAYRTASRRRHRILRRMQPLWRRMDRSIERLEGAMNRLHARADRLDDQMHSYFRILSSRQGVSRRLAASLTVRSVLSLLMLGAIGAAATVQFHLILRPMEVVGAGTGVIGGIPLNAVLSGVLLVMIALAGTLLLEACRVTRLFPQMGWTEEHVRRRIAIGTGLLLVALLLLTAGLAWTRDYIMAMERASRAVLADGVAPLPPLGYHWLPAVTQSLLTLCLGMAVASVALPLENLLRQLRVVIVSLCSLACGLVGGLAAWLAMGIGGLGRLLLTLYDVVVFLPLSAERAFRQIREGQRQVTDRSMPREIPSTADTAATRGDR